MTKELRDLAWSILPKEFKEKVKKDYVSIKGNPEWNEAYNCALEEQFGILNLASDAEGEDEVLTVNRKEVQEMYQAFEKFKDKDNTCFNLMMLFGSKCLPDEKPKPSEPKFKVGDKVTFAGFSYNVMDIINKGKGEFAYKLGWILPGEYSESEPTLCTNNFCQTEGQVVEHEGTQTSASTKSYTLDVEPNIFNTKPDNSDILNCALLKLEEASKAVREALTKVK